MSVDINLSIVTVCYNAVDMLQETLDSVYSQKYSGYEYWVVDGGSTDGTIDLLKTYKGLFDNKGINFQYISEKDNGIYHAMNKGIVRATGKWINFLNAGDTYNSEDTLSVFFEQLDKHLLVSERKMPAVAYGDYYKVHPNTKVLSKAYDIQSIIDRMCFCHQAAFTRRELLLKYLFDESLRIVADHKLFLTLYLEEESFCYIPIPIVDFDCQGISQNNDILLRKEEYLIKRQCGIYSGMIARRKWVCLQYELMRCHLRNWKRRWK